MQGVRDAGHETGIHCWDHIRWQDGVAGADERWTHAEMQRACERYTEIFREPPRTHGAAGWQMNVHALRLTQRLGFDYCSDGRGTHPHLPVWNAELIRCPQFPTTLPTLDEMVGIDGVTEDNVAAHLLERTRGPRRVDHVFTLHAELEGMRLAPSSSSCCSDGRRRAWPLGPVRRYTRRVEPMALPRCTTGPGTVAGRSGTLLVQGAEFLGDVDLAQAA